MELNKLREVFKKESKKVFGCEVKNKIKCKSF